MAMETQQPAKLVHGVASISVGLADSGHASGQVMFCPAGINSSCRMGAAHDGVKHHGVAVLRPWKCNPGRLVCKAHHQVTRRLVRSASLAEIHSFCNSLCAQSGQLCRSGHGWD